jgi:hypothetical protein
MFYQTLDQFWIEKKLNTFEIENFDIVSKISDFCFDSKQILESPNPVICCICDLIINRFIELELIQDLSESLVERIREALESTVFINSIDSHIDFCDVYQDFKEDIKKEITQHLQDDEYYSNCDDLNYCERVAELETEYYSLFNNYNF